VDAHRPPGRLHLAFSVFLFRPDGAVLLQRRSTSKYHFPGVWANACCSHPEPGEELLVSAMKRLGEELSLEPAGISPLRPAGSFVYRAVDGASGLVEHEYDHVLVAELLPEQIETLSPAADEVDVVRYAAVDEVDGYGPGEGFAPWFAEALAIAWNDYRSGAMHTGRARH
jgi:isopentenyl-diphosphate delta-isomerase